VPTIALSRRVEKVVGYPPLVDMDDRQRREFHEALSFGWNARKARSPRSVKARAPPPLRGGDGNPGLRGPRVRTHATNLAVARARTSIGFSNPRRKDPDGVSADWCNQPRRPGSRDPPGRWLVEVIVEQYDACGREQ
jgi:hypothetical protein